MSNLNQENIENMDPKKSGKSSGAAQNRRILQEIQTVDDYKSNLIANFENVTKPTETEVISVSTLSDSTISTFRSSTSGSTISIRSGSSSYRENEKRKNNDDFEGLLDEENNESDDDVFLNSYQEDQDDNEPIEHKPMSNEIQQPEKISTKLIEDIIMRSKVQTTEASQLFIDVVYIVEMFNQVVLEIYKKNSDECNLIKIDFVRFLQSLFSASTNEHDELAMLIRMLLGILMRKLKSENGLCNVPIERINLDRMSLLTAVIAVMRSVNTRIKNIIFHEVQSELDNIDSFCFMSTLSKIKLCQRLVEYLGIENKEMNITRFKKDLEHETNSVCKTLKELRNREFRLNGHTDADEIMLLREERRSLENYVNEMRKQIRDLQPIEPIGRFTLDDNSDKWISFWKFACLPGCLVVEQHIQITVDKDKEISFCEIDDCFSSTWCVVSDEKDLNQLQENVNRWANYMFTYQMTSVIRENRAFETRFYDDLSTILQACSSQLNDTDNDDLAHRTRLINDKFASILKEIVDVKEKIVSKSMISYKVVFSEEDRSLESFEFEKEPIEKFESRLNSPDDEKIEKLKTLLDSANSMVSKNYLGKVDWMSWKKSVSESRTLSELELMLYVLSENILWEEVSKRPVCGKCQSSSADVNNNNTPIEECSNCHVAYHLQCILGQEKSQEAPYLYNKSLRKHVAVIVCEKCYQHWIDRNKEEPNDDRTMMEIVDKVPEMINFGGRYSLRHNKARIERAIDEAENTAGRSRGKRRNPDRTCKKETKRFREEKSDDTETESSQWSQDKKTAPKRRGRPKNRIVEDTESEWDQKTDKTASTSSSQSVQTENDEEIAERRARLGLRPRRNVHYL